MVISSFIIYTAIIIAGETDLAWALLNGSWGLYVIGLLIMMYIYILRLDSSEFSMLSYPKWLINLLYILLTIISLLAFAIVICAIIFLFDIVYYLSIVLLLAYIGFTITLLGLFFKKLFVMMSKRLENNMEKGNNNNDNNDEENGQNVQSNNGVIIELSTLNSMIKYCLLVLQGIISTYIGNLMVLIAMANPGLPVYTWTAIDILVNSITLYFMFSFNNDQYNKCCSKCHGCCGQICISWIFNQYKNTLSLKDRQQYEAFILE